MPLLTRHWRLCLTLSLLVGAGLGIHAVRWEQRALFWLQQLGVGTATQAERVWLPGYRAAIQALPLADLAETSGLSYNPFTGTLFTVAGRSLLVELSCAGKVLRRIELQGTRDLEAVEVLGDGRLALIDERQRRLFTLRLPEGDASLDSAQLESFDLGFGEAGNKGFEGMAWDWSEGRLLLVKERSPLGLFSLPFPGEDGAPGLLQNEDTHHLFVRDLSSLTVDWRTGNRLLLSDESRLLVELDRQGHPLSFMSLGRGSAGLEHSVEQPEGVAMDEEGTIYMVGEPNLFYVFRKDKPLATPGG